MYRFACAAVFLIVLGWIVGCTPQGAKAPPTVRVSGTVRMNDKPMQGGEVYFSVKGFPAKICKIEDGKFSGDAYAGKNNIEVVWNKDDVASSTNPNMKKTVNFVSENYSGEKSLLNADIPEGAEKTFDFQVLAK